MAIFKKKIIVFGIREDPRHLQVLLTVFGITQLINVRRQTFSDNVRDPARKFSHIEIRTAVARKRTSGSCDFAISN